MFKPNAKLENFVSPILFQYSHTEGSNSVKFGSNSFGVRISKASHETCLHCRKFGEEIKLSKSRHAEWGRREMILKMLQKRVLKRILKMLPERIQKRILQMPLKRFFTE